MHAKTKALQNAPFKMFDLDGFTLHCLKTAGKFTLDLPGVSNKERLIFSLKGKFSVNGTRLAEKDMMYLPLGENARIESGEEAVIFVAETIGSKKFSPYVKKYVDAEKMKIGQPTFRRTVVQSITERDQANRFIAGYVEDSIGEWSSYPPHKHDDKPEAYIFFGLNPGFGVQLILDGDDERAYVVHDYDAVLIPKGYHPHVNTSLRGGSYAWVISAPPDSRNLAVEIHPAFKEVNLGKSHLSIK
ncbi:MAG TPA: 5-deoxy-glucuronate isomerase [Nitrososphaerales archaeon]|nr:5-deoxy-glucuronate isomerase [Nitrososphaerales archaeon]